MSTADFPIRLVETPAELDGLLRDLATPARIAVDTEAASYHPYSDAACPVQLSTPAGTAVGDVVKLPAFGALGALLMDARVETTFHDADYDLRLLDRDHHFGVAEPKLLAKLVWQRPRPQCSIETIDIDASARNQHGFLPCQPVALEEL